jgi:sulfatase-like protein
VAPNQFEPLRTLPPLLALVSLLSPGCGHSDSPSADSERAPLWAPGIQDQSIATVRSPVTHGQSEFLTAWYGLSTDRLITPAPALLSDNRDALLVSVPSHFFVDLAASLRPRKLTTAIRRTTSHPRLAVHCEVFWQTQSQIQSLGQVSLPPAVGLVSEAWQELMVVVPSEPGRLQFISRIPGSGANPGTTTALAWMAPRVEYAEAARPLPDVLLLTIDTLRADALQYAPRLQTRLQEGAFWPQAIAPSNWTLPSYGSLFTGLAADAHGAGRGIFSAQASGQNEDRQLSPISSELPTLAQYFREAGYATAMVHQNPMLESWAGFAKGFEQYVRASDRNTDALEWAKGWWASNSNRPRFLVVHLMAPHLPYRFGPEPDPMAELSTSSFFVQDHSPDQRAAYFDLTPEQKERVRARYASEVAQLDADLEPFLNPILTAHQESTIFAFYVDHGEEFWDAGSFEHGHSFDDSVIRVPVALQFKGKIAPGLHPETVPAYGLSGSLLTLVGLQHSFQVNLQSPPDQFASSMPLYRSRRGGRLFEHGQSSDLAFDFQVKAGGRPAAISAAQMRMLQELGYLANKALKPTEKGK